MRLVRAYICIREGHHPKRDDYEDVNPQDFPGVTLGDLWELDELFDVSISVFLLNPDGPS